MPPEPRWFPDRAPDAGPVTRWADDPDVTGCYVLFLLLEGLGGLGLALAGGLHALEELPSAVTLLIGLVTIVGCYGAAWLWERPTRTDLRQEVALSLLLALPLLPLGLVAAAAAGLSRPWWSGAPLPLLPFPLAALLTVQGLATLAVVWLRRPHERTNESKEGTAPAGEAEP